MKNSLKEQVKLTLRILIPDDHPLNFKLLNKSGSVEEDTSLPSGLKDWNKTKEVPKEAGKEASK